MRQTNLPGQHSQQTEEYHDSKLENILDLVHLIVFIGAFVDKLCGAVGKQFVLLDDNITNRLHCSKVAKLDKREVGAVDQNVIQLDVKMTEVLGVDKLES